MASEANKEGINLGIDGVDKDNGLELEENIQKFIITEPANQRGLNTAGSKVVNSNDLLSDSRRGWQRRQTLAGSFFHEASSGNVRHKD